MNHTQEKLPDIYLNLNTNPDTGLSDGQVAEIQAKKGLNKFDEEKKETVPQRILYHLKDLTSIILLVAAGIAFVLAFQGIKGITDGFVILSIVILNLCLAIRQEMGAEKALDALKNMNAQMTVVLRNGAKESIDAVGLVPGDILMLEAGDLIPADARLVESVNLKVEESILTGESVPVEKDADAVIADKAPLGDQTNMLFSGCLITNGRTKAVVVATGMHTEMGKIAGMLNETKKSRTPLQKRLNRLGRNLCMLAIVSAVLLIIMQMYHGVTFMNVLMDAVALAVAVVPEALPVAVTITLAFGVFNMAKKRAIIRKIAAVETLGSASVICSDKTGTLTMNRMAIQKLWAVDHDPIDAHEKLNHDQRWLMEMLGLASNATIEDFDGVDREIGDPTETSIIRLLKDKNITKGSIDAIFPRVHEIPFDSDRKLMTTVHELEDMRYISITKGAFDRIPIEATSVCIDTAQRIHDEFAGNALRIIACAYKYYDKLPEVLDADELEHGLTFAGFVGMIDPPRPESMAAVQTAKEAGIKTIMITGDHAMTAKAIAHEIGIYEEGDRVVTGAELDGITEEALINDVKSCSVYARVSPEDKIRIVQAWQHHKEVVAMTGDGVNDAPALKAADVGVAMGSGTDVSKSASDVVLTDDNFASIISAVAEGRRVFDNIRKVLYSLLSCNISEILTMLIAVALGWGTPIFAIQLLFINVVADGVPVMFIFREAMEADAMKRKPYNTTASIFAYGLGTRIVVMAAIFAATSLIGFYIGRFVEVSSAVAPSHEVGVTMCFLIIGWSSIVNIFNIRSRTQSIFQVGVRSNMQLFFALCFSLAMMTLMPILPIFRQIFHCVYIAPEHWLWMIVLSVPPLVAIEIQKIFLRSRLRRAA